MQPVTLWVARVAGPRPDPAFDTTHPDWERLALAYMRSRTATALAALPVKDGRTPVLFGVHQLTPAAYRRLASDMTLVERYQLAVRVGCHARKDASGPTSPRTLDDRGVLVAEESWVAEIAARWGHAAVEEVGEVVLRLYQVGPPSEEDDADPLGLYALPPGLAVARRRSTP